MWQRRSEIGAYSHAWDRDYGEPVFGPEGVLSDEIVDTLASVGPIVCLAELEGVGSQWAWFGQYGDSLLDALLAMSIPALTQSREGQNALQCRKMEARLLPRVTRNMNDL